MVEFRYIDTDQNSLSLFGFFIFYTKKIYNYRKSIINVQSMLKRDNFGVELLLLLNLIQIESEENFQINT